MARVLGDDAGLQPIKHRRVAISEAVAAPVADARGAPDRTQGGTGRPYGTAHESPNCCVADKCGSRLLTPPICNAR